MAPIPASCSPGNNAQITLDKYPRIGYGVTAVAQFVNQRSSILNTPREVATSNRHVYAGVLPVSAATARLRVNTATTGCDF